MLFRNYLFTGKSITFLNGLKPDLAAFGTHPLALFMEAAFQLLHFNFTFRAFHGISWSDVKSR